MKKISIKKIRFQKNKKEKIKQIILIIILALLFPIVFLIWKSSEGKTIWDLTELLIIPSTLAIFAFVIDSREKQTDREIAEDNQREIALQNYFDTMTNLILEHNLKISSTSDTVRDIARVKTITTIKRLDIARQGMLIRFLSEARLVTREKDSIWPIIDLSGLSLNSVDLGSMDLYGANLNSTQLTNAWLNNTDLKKANLFAANLEGATLEYADLSYSQLWEVNMRNAKLDHAILNGANLTNARLENASFSDTIYDSETIWPKNFNPKVAGLSFGNEL